MMRYGTTIWIFCCLLASPVLAQSITVSANIENRDIYLGQSFNYQIVITGGKPEGIDVSSLEPFNPSNRQVSNRSFNGYVTANITYQLTAFATGTYTIPSVSVTVAGKSYQTQPIDVTIRQPIETDLFGVEYRFSNDHCYVGEPVTMTIRWVLFTESIQNPSFTVPLFRSNDYIFEHSPFDPRLKTPDQAQIDGQQVNVQQFRDTIKGKSAIVVQVQKIILPRKSGLLQHDPISITADLPVERVRDRSVFGGYRNIYKRFIASSSPVTLEAQALPTEGRPADFYGLIGNYQINTSASPTQVNVGDPITLTIRVQGDLLNAVQWPDLEGIDELMNNFRLPPDKSPPVIDNGALVFTQTLRPNNGHVKRIPPISLPTFDVKQGRYIMTQSDPIPLEVTATQTLTSADMQGVSHTPMSREVEAIDKGLAANHEDEDCLVDQYFEPFAALVQPLMLCLWALPLLGLVGSGIAKSLTCSTPQQKAARRQRRAAGQASQAIKAAGAQAKDQRHQAMGQALQQYLGDRFDRTAASITAGDAYRILLQVTEKESLAQDYRRLLESCEAAQYAPMAAQIDDAFIDQALELIRQIEKEARS